MFYDSMTLTKHFMEKSGATILTHYTYLPASNLSSSRTLFLRSTSPGCPATVADDDTAPEGGEILVVEAEEVDGTLSVLVVVGEMVFDETQVAVDTIGIAVVTRETADTPIEVTVLTEPPMGVVNTEGTPPAPDEAIVVINSLDGILAVEVTVGTDTMGPDETIVVDSEEDAEFDNWSGDTALVDVIEAIVVEVEGVEEAVAVVTMDIIGVMTRGDVVRTKTAAAGA